MIKINRKMCEDMAIYWHKLGGDADGFGFAELSIRAILKKMEMCKNTECSDNIGNNNPEIPSGCAAWGNKAKSMCKDYL